MRSAVCETGIPATNRHSGARDGAKPESTTTIQDMDSGLRQVAHPAMTITRLIWN
jgi:hypothetical protein